MRVLVINGSPHQDGCTKRALDEVIKVLESKQIETIYIHVGNKVVAGCKACGFCKENHKCVIDDIVNETAKIFDECDGILIGSPVYYSGINGTLKSFLDRLFNSSYIKKSLKVGAAVITSRRAGSTNALDEIYKYFGISNMPIATSSYWNEVHGINKTDVEKDLEGLQTMRNLGKNMAFLIKSIYLGKKEHGLPDYETKAKTNFID